MNLAYGVIMTMIMVVRGEWQSPCPSIFKYEKDHGDVYGTIEINTSSTHAELEVELIVDHPIKEYKGMIKLLTPKEEVPLAIAGTQPLKYKVMFPLWTNEPPKLVKITINGDVKCSSTEKPSKLPVTTVKLNHRLFTTNPSSYSHLYKGEDFLNNDGILSINKTTITKSVNTSKTTVQSTSLKRTKITALSLDPKKPEEILTRFKEFESPDICGTTVTPNPLISFGKSTSKYAFPWLVALFVSTGSGVEFRCTGTLVSNQHVITAAHCVEKNRQSTAAPISPEKLVVALGKHNLQNFGIRDGEKMVGAEDVKIHPQCTRDTADADIAVVTLSEKIEFSNYIRPICLWSESDEISDIVGKKGTVVGWGREGDKIVSPEPQQVSMPVVSQEECLKSAEAFSYITSNRTFCAGDREDGGPCHGSGASFIMKRNDKWTLRGILAMLIYDSEKNSCDLRNYVAFVDVSKFKTWISEIISN